jgi:hypothetical protein
MKKVKEIKKLSREAQLEDIKKRGDSEKIPRPKVFKNKKKEQQKNNCRGPGGQIFGGE